MIADILKSMNMDSDGHEGIEPEPSYYMGQSQVVDKEVAKKGTTYLKEEKKDNLLVSHKKKHRHHNHKHDKEEENSSKKEKSREYHKSGLAKSKKHGYEEDRDKHGDYKRDARHKDELSSHEESKKSHKSSGKNENFSKRIRSPDGKSKDADYHSKKHSKETRSPNNSNDHLEGDNSELPLDIEKQIPIEFQDKPIQLIKINHDQNKFQVCEEGLRLLQQIDGNLGIVAFTGPYRTGKSFTLNLLLDKVGKGFTVDSSVNSCTQGLWIWGKPVYMNDSKKHLVFIDTEGSGSVDRTNTHDAKIFALVVLISSYLVYNSMGVIDERAIANLSLASELTKNIEMKISSGKEKKEAIANITPKFLWALKDFTLELRDENDHLITANDYLEASLNTNLITEKTGTSATKIREAIVKLFRQRECMTFVRPVEDEDLLQNLGSASLREMRPEFVKQFEFFKRKLFSECPAKAVNGKNITGRMLGTLLEQYVRAINEGAVPNISTAWENVVDCEIRRAYDLAAKLYKEKTDKLATVKELPMEQDLLITKLYEIRIDSDSLFSKSNKLADADSNSRLFKTYCDKLTSLYLSREDDIKSKNTKLSEEQCHTKLTELLLQLEKKAMENKYNLEDLKSIYNDIRELLNNYDKVAKGNRKVAVLQKTLPKFLQKLLESIARANKEKIQKIESNYKVKMTELEQKVGLDKQELERLKDIEKALKEKMSNHEALMKQVERNEQNLAKKVEEAVAEKDEKEHQVEQLKDTVSAHKAELDRLQKMEKEVQKKEREEKRRKEKETKKKHDTKTVSSKRPGKGGCKCVIL